MNKDFQSGIDYGESSNEKINVRMENGKMVVTKLPGEEISAGSEALKKKVSDRLPEIELTD